jgi:hypothetical protein
MAFATTESPFTKVSSQPFEVVIRTHDDRTISITACGKDSEDVIAFPVSWLDWIIKTLTEVRAATAN